MNKEIEVKGSNLDEVTKKITDEYGNDCNFEIIELKKSKSILGFINTSGLYKVILKEKENENKKISNDEVIETKTPLEIETKVKELIELMDLDLKFNITETNGRYLINFNGKDNGILIGKKGKTLNSFEFLLSSILDKYKIDIDVEGFKAKREETLKDLANKMVSKVRETERAVKLNPMPPRERKIIHEAVNCYEDIDTYSEGKDPKRYIVIRKKR
ncbi:MAG: KH domain-containing protein [Fusobacteria bacterium]|nr:KH domain-containing protein [Fusobacteriota bacterium]